MFGVERWFALGEFAIDLLAYTHFLFRFLLFDLVFALESAALGFGLALLFAFVLLLFVESFGEFFLFEFEGLCVFDEIGCVDVRAIYELNQVVGQRLFRFFLEQCSD